MSFPTSTLRLCPFDAVKALSKRATLQMCHLALVVKAVKNKQLYVYSRLNIHGEHSSLSFGSLQRISSRLVSVKPSQLIPI